MVRPFVSHSILSSRFGLGLLVLIPARIFLDFSRIFSRSSVFMPCDDANSSGSDVQYRIFFWSDLPVASSW